MMDAIVGVPDATDGALDMLLSRASEGALRDPAPSEAEVEQMVAAGLRAPDHGRLRPWRFVVIQGAARARFADVAIAALRARDPNATEAEVERMRGKLTSPPLILVLGMHLTETPKVPETEQVQSVAAAAMNVLNAAHALGFAGKWVSGPNAYDPAVAAALGFVAPDRVLGFLYLGTAMKSSEPTRRPQAGDFLTRWDRPAVVG